MRLKFGETTVDHYRLDFGFRTVRVEGASILLNGEPVFLKGFGRHEDLAVIGKGMNLPFMVKDFNLMRWIGANSFRTAHYPYSEEQMRMADRQGLLVINEAAANTISMCAVNCDADAKQRLLDLHIRHGRELVERDYNHACVIGWSMGNECEMYGHFEPDGYFTKVLRGVKPLDQSRPFTFVSMAASFLHEIETMDAEEFDFIAYNAYPGWYFENGRPQSVKVWLDAQFKQLWEVFKKPILLAEFGADALPGLHDEYNLMWTEEYQSELVREFLEFANECPHCCGAHIWNFADFKVGQHTGRIVLNWKGVFTRDRHPKMTAHKVRQMWTGHEGLMQPPVESAQIDEKMLDGARYV
jgi:beta-glucuronidase